MNRCKRCDFRKECSSTSKCPFDNPEALVVEDWGNWRKMMKYEGALEEYCVEKGGSPIKGCASGASLPF